MYAVKACVCVLLETNVLYLYIHTDIAKLSSYWILSVYRNTFVFAIMSHSRWSYGQASANLCSFQVIIYHVFFLPCALCVFLKTCKIIVTMLHYMQCILFCISLGHAKPCPLHNFSGAQDLTTVVKFRHTITWLGFKKSVVVFGFKWD